MPAQKGVAGSDGGEYVIVMKKPLSGTAFIVMCQHMMIPSVVLRAAGVVTLDNTTQLE